MTLVYYTLANRRMDALTCPGVSLTISQLQLLMTPCLYKISSHVLIALLPRTHGATQMVNDISSVVILVRPLMVSTR